MRAPGQSGGSAAGQARPLFMLALSLMATALVFDLFDLATRTGALGLHAYWMTAAGLAVGASALALPLCGVGSAGPWHRMRGNASAPLARWVALALFGASWVLRRPEADIPLTSLVLSALGAAVGVLVAAGWRVRAPEPQGPATGAGESPWADSRSRLDSDSLPPETGRARAH